jgi:hypothetical protein
MPEDLSLAPATATATVHPVEAATSRMVHEQLASGRPDIGLLWELCLRVEFERPILDAACCRRWRSGHRGRPARCRCPGHRRSTRGGPCCS